ncbi:MAG: 50S ribosomal protein L13 [Spirochaetes bacterium GWD1_61_31]|nr:MAG: 50S ribosomal protein L13 [Spirochaetes bacterium GWB1_60_80]OHD33448.1 MAG: 50S ribosomal protein L13 [Spirochaetes bacterium GWC1_61_12]OHD40577.1 MAG: 50S ribosomal protein L13 [Spirochaetes bacterium GWD1_61_31]OHD59292.1 MAG: 50S ribosomal protein L13 [Spirochaetes bacterium GWF1_60_12]HAP44587.1 50S ribosomal protein L13 [Spirochaetaceae bacterium]
MKTLFVKPEDAGRNWFVIDAQGKRLGRVAVKVATLLRGKHKPNYSPHWETGDFVVIINADKIDISGRKRENKIYYHHTGFVGGLKDTTFARLIDRNPVQPLEIAIRGMLPKGPLGRRLFTNVKVYAGPTHPHVAQQPKAIEI